MSTIHHSIGESPHGMGIQSPHLVLMDEFLGNIYYTANGVDGATSHSAPLTPTSEGAGTGLFDCACDLTQSQFLQCVCDALAESGFPGPCTEAAVCEFLGAPGQPCVFGPFPGNLWDTHLSICSGAGATFTNEGIHEISFTDSPADNGENRENITAVRLTALAPGLTIKAGGSAFGGETKDFYKMLANTGQGYLLESTLRNDWPLREGGSFIRPVLLKIPSSLQNEFKLKEWISYTIFPVMYDGRTDDAWFWCLSKNAVDDINTQSIWMDSLNLTDNLEAFRAMLIAIPHAIITGGSGLPSNLTMSLPQMGSGDEFTLDYEGLNFSFGAVVPAGDGPFTFTDMRDAVGVNSNDDGVQATATVTGTVLNGITTDAEMTYSFAYSETWPIPTADPETDPDWFNLIGGAHKAEFHNMRPHMNPSGPEVVGFGGGGAQDVDNKEHRYSINYAAGGSKTTSTVSGLPGCTYYWTDTFADPCEDYEWGYDVKEGYRNSYTFDLLFGGITISRRISEQDGSAFGSGLPTKDFFYGTEVYTHVRRVYLVNSQLTSEALSFETRQIDTNDTSEPIPVSPVFNGEQRSVGTGKIFVEDEPGGTEFGYFKTSTFTPPLPSGTNEIDNGDEMLIAYLAELAYDVQHGEYLHQGDVIDTNTLATTIDYAHHNWQDNINRRYRTPLTGGFIEAAPGEQFRTAFPPNWQGAVSAPFANQPVWIDHPPEVNNLGQIFWKDSKDGQHGICVVRLDSGYDSARTDYWNQLMKFRNPLDPDYQNQIKLKEKRDALDAVQVVLVNNFASPQLIDTVEPGKTHIIGK